MKVYRILLSYIMLLFLGTMTLINLYIPDKKFSEAENRTLKDKPTFSWESLKEGRFTKEYEEYITDQFAFRDFWVSMKAFSERLLQKRDNNGVYLGRDGYLLQKIDKIDEDILNKNIEAVNTFANNNPGIKTYFLLVPNSVKVLENKLPPFASSEDQLNILKNVQEKMNKHTNFISIYNILAGRNNEYIYYKTDHHWTSLGAYYAYNYLGKVMKYTPLSIEDFNIEEVTDKFYGTLYSRGNYRFVKPDSIHIFKPKTKLSYKVEHLDTGTSSDSLYELKYLEKKDKYSVFLDGNHALSIIRTNNRADKKLLVVKDSYAHSLVPFLTNHYDEIHMMDLRYFNMSVGKYMKENDIEEVLLLYNTASFVEDKSIMNLKFK